MPKAKPKHRERPKTPPIAATATAADGSAAGAASDVKSVASSGVSGAGAMTRRDVYFSLLSSSLSAIVHIPRELIRIIFQYSQSSNDLNLISISTSPRGWNGPGHARAGDRPRVSVWSGDIFDGYMDAAYREIVYAGIAKETVSAGASTDSAVEYVRFSARAEVTPQAVCQPELDFRDDAFAGPYDEQLLQRARLCVSRHNPGNFILLLAARLFVYRPLASDEKQRRHSEAVNKQTDIAVAAAAAEANGAAAAGAGAAGVAPPALVRAVSAASIPLQHFELFRRTEPLSILISDMAVCSDARPNGREFVIITTITGTFRLYEADTLILRLARAEYSGNSAGGHAQTIIPLRDGRVFLGGMKQLVCIDTRTIPVGRATSSEYKLPAEPLSFHSNRRFSHMCMLDDGFTLAAITARESYHDVNPQWLCTFDVRRKKVTSVDPSDGSSTTTWTEVTDVGCFEIKDTNHDPSRTNMSGYFCTVSAIAGGRLLCQTNDGTLIIYLCKTGQTIVKFSRPTVPRVRPIVMRKGCIVVGVCPSKGSRDLSGDHELVVWDTKPNAVGYSGPDPITTIDEMNGHCERLAVLPLDRFAAVTDADGIRVYATDSFQTEIVLADPMAPPPIQNFVRRAHQPHPNRTVNLLLAGVES